MCIGSIALTERGILFLNEWYRCIDEKEDFSQLDEKTVGEEIVVDFPNNPMGRNEFRKWYEGQCRSYTGKHFIHSVLVCDRQDYIEIFAEITWRARDSAGNLTELYPNVTLKLQPDCWKVFYYGCVDRPDSG